MPKYIESVSEKATDLMPGKFYFVSHRDQYDFTLLNQFICLVQILRTINFGH